jgi:hypothetical protein
MKTTMKRLAAYLLAMLLVLQIMPVMAEEGTYSAIFTPGYVQYRDILEITADIETSILTVDMENQLSATKGYDGIKWSSDHPEIATVDENGLVKAVAPGQVRITVEAEGYSDSVVFLIVEVPQSEEPTVEEEPLPEDNQDEEPQEEESQPEDNQPEETHTEEAQAEPEKPRVREKIIVIINGSKTKLAYDGLEHVNDFTSTSNSDSFDPDMVSLKPEAIERAATGTNCGTYQDKYEPSDFIYNGDADAEFIVSNGWLQIKPVSITIKANDVTQEEDEELTFTATVTGLVDEADLDTLQYTFDVYTSGDVTYITPVCEQVQGNYRITVQPGILTMKAGTYRAIRLTSDWPEGQPAYEGDMITMTAELIGFENVNYTLQWQHSTDMQEWINEPGANGTTYTYELNAMTVQYTWRVVANYLTR